MLCLACNPQHIHWSCPRLHRRPGYYLERTGHGTAAPPQHVLPHTQRLVSRPRAMARRRWGRAGRRGREALLERRRRRGAVFSRVGALVAAAPRLLLRPEPREERSLRPHMARAAREGDRAADARREFHNCQSCTLYAGAEGREQSDR
jgi:hypothetical protein